MRNLKTPLYISHDYSGVFLYILGDTAASISVNGHISPKSINGFDHVFKYPVLKTMDGGLAGSHQQQ